MFLTLRTTFFLIALYFTVLFRMYIYIRLLVVAITITGLLLSTNPEPIPKPVVTLPVPYLVHCEYTYCKIM